MSVIVVMFICLPKIPRKLCERILEGFKAELTAQESQLGSCGPDGLGSGSRLRQPADLLLSDLAW